MCITFYFTVCIGFFFVLSNNSISKRLSTADTIAHVSGLPEDNKRCSPPKKKQKKNEALFSPPKKEKTRITVFDYDFLSFFLCEIVVRVLLRWLPLLTMSFLFFD